MRYAIVSDLHANIQAWKAVYEDIQNNNADRIICLGDLVGYGPNPAQLLKEVRNKVDAVILGNHDAALCGKLDISLFNDDARLLLEWTRKQLSTEDLAFISSLPLTLIGDGFLCAHGEFAEPGSFNYASESEEVLPSWKATTADLLFVGHTHEPAIMVLGNSGIPRIVEPQDFKIDTGKRYFVNAGSVGQPRDKDPRACYCIYDTETRSIYWRRVAFDVESYRKGLKATGLKLDPSYYLPDPSTATEQTATNWHVTFSPPKSPAQAAHDVVAVQDLKTIPRRKNGIPLSMISLAVFVMLVAGIAIWRTIPHKADINAASATPLAASEHSSLSFPAKIVKPGEPIAGWDVHLEDKINQQVGINLDPFKQPFLYFNAKNDHKGILLSSSWISVKPGENWSFDASFQKKKDFSGEASLFIMLQQSGGNIVSNFVALKIPPPEVSGLSKAQVEFTIPENGTLIRLALRGNFAGKLLLLSPKLFVSKRDASQPDHFPTNTQGAGTAHSGQPNDPNDKWSMKAK